jgi:aminoglycoside/choline kinase family phosphotransferase
MEEAHGVKKELIDALISLSGRAPGGALGTGAEAVVLTRGGSGRTFVRLRDGERSLVAMMQPGGGEEFERYIEIGEFLEGCGVGVPTFYAVDRSRGIVLMEDMGELHLEDALGEAGPEREIVLYRDCLDVLATLQTTVTGAMRSAGLLAGRRFDGELLLAETEYFEREFVGRYAGVRCPPGWDAERRMLAERLAAEPAVFMHRDFQSRNILLKEGKVRIVDFQTAYRGPGAYDTASLLKDPYHPLGPGVRRGLLREYHGRLLVAGGAVETRFERFNESFVLAGIQRNCQALAAYAFLGLVRGKREFLDSIPSGLRLLEEGIVESGGFPALRALIGELRDKHAKGTA